MLLSCAPAATVIDHLSDAVVGGPQRSGYSGFVIPYPPRRAPGKQEDEAMLFEPGTTLNCNVLNEQTVGRAIGASRIEHEPDGERGGHGAPVVERDELGGSGVTSGASHRRERNRRY